MNAFLWSHRGLPVDVNVVHVVHRWKHMSGVMVVIVEQRFLLQSVTVGFWQRICSIKCGCWRWVLRLGCFLAATRNPNHAKDKASCNARC